MNRFRLLFLLISIPLSSAVFAQNFTEVTGTPFAGVALSAVAFADVDGDHDQDVPDLLYREPIFHVYPKRQQQQPVDFSPRWGILQPICLRRS